MEATDDISWITEVVFGSQYDSMESLSCCQEDSLQSCCVELESTDVHEVSTAHEEDYCTELHLEKLYVPSAQGHIKEIVPTMEVENNDIVFENVSVFDNLLNVYNEHFSDPPVNVISINKNIKLVDVSECLMKMNYAQLSIYFSIKYIRMHYEQLLYFYVIGINQCDHN